MCGIEEGKSTPVPKHHTIEIFEGEEA